MQSCTVSQLFLPTGKKIITKLKKEPPQLTDVLHKHWVCKTWFKLTVCKGSQNIKTLQCISETAREGLLKCTWNTHPGITCLSSSIQKHFTGSFSIAYTSYSSAFADKNHKAKTTWQYMLILPGTLSTDAKTERCTVVSLLLRRAWS